MAEALSRLVPNSDSCLILLVRHAQAVNATFCVYHVVSIFEAVGQANLFHYSDVAIGQFVANLALRVSCNV